MLINVFRYEDDKIRDQIQADARAFAEQNTELGDAQFVTSLYKALLAKYPPEHIDIESASFEVFVEDPGERLLILALRARFGPENVIVVGAIADRPGVARQYSYVLYVVDEVFFYLHDPLPASRRFRVVTDTSERLFCVRSAFDPVPLQKLLRFKSKANLDIDALVTASLAQPIESNGSFLLPVEADADYLLMKDHGLVREPQLTEASLFFSKAQLREGVVVDLYGFGRVRVNFDYNAIKNEDNIFDPNRANGQYLVSIAKTEAALTVPVETGKGTVVVGGRPYSTSFGECSAPFFGVLPCRLLTVRLGFGQAHIHISFKDGKPRVAWVRRTE